MCYLFILVCHGDNCFLKMYIDIETARVITYDLLHLKVMVFNQQSLPSKLILSYPRIYIGDPVFVLSMFIWLFIFMILCRLFKLNRILYWLLSFFYTEKPVYTEP